MVSRPHEPVIECQSCGKVLQKLTEAQAQQVAANPYNFIGFCAPCKALGLHIEEAYR